MKNLILCAVLMGGTFGVVARAGGSRSPESLGAHWARVSDEAGIQLIVDELRAVAEGSAVVGRKHAPKVLVTTKNQSLIAQHAMTMATVAAERWSVRLRGAAAIVVFSTGDTLRMQKTEGMWQVSGGSIPDFHSRNTINTTASLAGESGVSVGETFIATPLSREHNIERLSKGVTQSKIERELFGSPGKTASYFSVRYAKSAPFLQATYVQFVLDPEWNRIVYGNMDKWLKTYSVQSPSAIAVDADGNVFVGEPAKNRVLVLQLTGSGDEVQLQHRHQINNVSNPTDLAINDNGTPLNTSDDLLYVADASQNKIFKYTAGANRNALIATYEGFVSPTSIAVGRWNGASCNLLYVVDKIAKRIRVFEDEGTSLSLIREYRGTYAQYFSALKTDHFGNVYVVDNVSSTLIKFTPSLEVLDAEGGDETFASLNSIDIPFGKIVVEGEGNYWTGFNQLFAIERWDDRSGVQRRTLGLKLKNIDFHADDDISIVSNTFTMTDVGNTGIRIYDENKRLVRTLTSSWMVAGQKTVLWDRRADNGAQVPPGTYRYEIAASSAYADEPAISNTRFYLPMYYHDDCGSTDRLDDTHLAQGSVVTWGATPAQTASEHASSVQYRFTGLKPGSDYEVAAEYATGDGVQRLQQLSASGVRLHEPMRVSNEPVQTGYLELPKESYADGEVTIGVNRLGEGSAIVTQLWIKETGVGFTPQPVATVPSAYSLRQNFPNPFNPTTTIRYGIPEDGIVTLKVYSITGQEVATLVNEHKSAGSYQVQFEAKNVLGNSLASGVYFYRVTAGGFAETKKMILMK